MGWINNKTLNLWHCFGNRQQALPEDPLENEKLLSKIWKKVD